jgi:chromosome segregation ATPase
MINKMKKKTKEKILNDINKTIKGLEENNRKSDQSYRETSKFVSQKKKEIQEIEQKIKEMDKKAAEEKRHSGKLGLAAAALLTAGAGYTAYQHYKDRD